MILIFFCYPDMFAHETAEVLLDGRIPFVCAVGKQVFSSCKDACSL